MCKCISARCKTQYAASRNSFALNQQKHRRYLFVQSVPGELTSGEKGKPIAAFTHHKATCRAVNMCCYLAYDRHECVFFVMHQRLLSLHRAREQDVVVLTRRCIFAARLQVPYEFHTAFTCHFVSRCFPSPTSITFTFLVLFTCW